MKFGKYEAELEALREKGQDVPMLDERPDIQPESWPYWYAFTDLHNRARPVGFGLAGIPFGEINAWLDVHNITDRDEREEYSRIVGALDRLWLAVKIKEDSRKGKK